MSKPSLTQSALNKATATSAGARTDQIMNKDREDRHSSYREQALKMYPWVCAKCAREFTVSRLRELTVHHKDHNHNNNPADGSNWELLCLFCHDAEHEAHPDTVIEAGADAARPNATFKAFADLGSLLKPK